MIEAILQPSRCEIPELDQMLASFVQPVSLPVVRSLADLKSIPASGDPSGLFQDRFLCRGGALLVVGQTGFGKSSFIMQGAITWAQGKPFLGIVPTKSLRSLIIQAENDDGDLVEARDGVKRGMVGDGQVTDAEFQEATQMVQVVTVDNVTGENFCLLLEQLIANCEALKPDLVFIDPLLAYLGGDVSKQDVASTFLRNGLNPILHRHNIGMIVVHHTNKPPREVRATMNGDVAYLGSGSAELPNWARAMLCIQAVPDSNHVYRLFAGKRGRRLHWKDANGNIEYSKFIAHSTVPGRIYWVEPSPADIPEGVESVKPGRKSKDIKTMVNQAFDIINRTSDKWLRVKTFQAEIQSKLGIGKTICHNVVKALLDEKRLVRQKINIADEQFDIIGFPGITDVASNTLRRPGRVPDLPDSPPPKGEVGNRDIRQIRNHNSPPEIPKIPIMKNREIEESGQFEDDGCSL